MIEQALADESEYVRETGLKAGQKIINMYAQTSIELLLPEVGNLMSTVPDFIRVKKRYTCTLYMQL